MSNLTVFMLTGDKSSVLSAVKTLSESTDAYSTVVSSSTPVKTKPTSTPSKRSASRMYNAHTFVFVKDSLPAFQQKIANHYISNKKEVYFKDLKDHILSGNPTTFSNAALSNYLRANDYERNIRHYSDKTTKIVWVKK